jgi:tripartite-type tricarboxylate transporter receptor subunit TctC
MRSIRSGQTALLAAFTLAVSMTAASAQSDPAASYPNKPIHFVLGFAAGGGTDLLARIVGPKLSEILGQPVIVENRTGAAGMIEANALAKAPPDGHMLLMATSGEIAISHHLYKEKMTYDPMRELAPVALFGIVPCVVVVAEATPVRTPQELVAYAQANAGKLTFSSSGVGNPQQLAGELMNMMAGLNVLHVPYRGAAPAVTDVATGAVTMSFTSLAAAQGLLQAGKIRAVAVTSLDRMPQLPDVEPLQNGSPGLKGYELLNWFGVFATAGTPSAVVDRLNAIVVKAQREPKIAETLNAQGIVPRQTTPEQFKAFVQSESQKFAGIIEKANIKLAN